MNNVLKAREEMFARTEKETQQIIGATSLPFNIKNFFSIWNTDTALVVSPEDLPKFRRLAGVLVGKQSVMNKEIEDKYNVHIYRSDTSGMIIEGFVHGEMLMANLDRASSDPYRITKFQIHEA